MKIGDICFFGLDFGGFGFRISGVFDGKFRF